MPHYAPPEMAADDVPDFAREPGHPVEDAEAALAVRVATRHRIWLLPSTLMFRAGERIRNSAPLIAPIGGVAFAAKPVTARLESEERPALLEAVRRGGADRSHLSWPAPPPPCPVGVPA